MLVDRKEFVAVAFASEHPLADPPLAIEYVVAPVPEPPLGVMFTVRESLYFPVLELNVKVRDGLCAIF
jgi:hypothetical protein